MIHNIGFGSLHKVNTPRFALITASTLGLFLIFLLVIMSFVPWQQTSFGSGKVMAFSPVERDQTVKAPMTARIAKWHVQEGETVVKGQILVELEDNDPDLGVRLGKEKFAAETKVNAISISIKSIKEQVLALKRVKKLSLEQADAEIRMAQNKLKASVEKQKAANAGRLAAKQNIDRQKELFEKGLVSKRDLEVAQMKYSDSDASFFKAKADVAASQGEIAAKKADRERKAADIDAKIAKEEAAVQKSMGDRANADATLAKAETSVSRQEQMIIRAPRDGTIARVLVMQGSEYVKAGDPLALLVPTTVKQAVAIWVDGNDVPLIRPGREVRLQFEGWPAVQFSGWPSIAVGTFGGIVSFVDATADVDGRFRVVVEPGSFKWPEQRYLRQGARANAWILLNQVKVGYEIWRKLNGFPPVYSRSGSSSDDKKSSGTK